ncbi:MAG: bifunctional 3-phosphoshikimate 1-carboxyvinyltransferase/cytidylate kinase [Zoogloeaceae bacterium]|jgi:3-phosphoshikimate 1-carboxyvinyltransferase|nr:bifunctional 3-phosphoshikimate 1-carboxyvinyltransferase/cytidylate kinase [Zoogloeaceae bacterium]
MNFLDLPQTLSASGDIRLPGSKSISNRALLLAALADGVTEIRNLLVSDDTARMLEALRALGVEITESGAGNWRVHGAAGRIPVRRAELFLGNAGTAFRSLTAVLALAGGDADYTLTGVPRMHERPIGDLADALRQLGATIDYLGKTGYPPLRVRGRREEEAGGEQGREAARTVKIRGDVSSQFLTGLLLALPLMEENIVVEVTGALISRPYVEITLNLMARFGVSVERQGWQSFRLPAGARYVSPGAFHVEGDASSASYFLAMGAIGAAGSNGVRVEGVGRQSIQGDVRFAEALAEMGATIETGDHWISARAPSAGLRGITLDCNSIPDAAMTLAIVALFAKGETTLANIASWRVKETDRIAAMVKELGKLGARAEAGADCLRVTPPDAQNPLRPAIIDTYDDHRMAMCFSLASFALPLRINNPECVAKTFPDYFRAFARIARPAPVIAIDGPTASGKGTVAARVAAALGFHYLDSGALYRLAALAARDKGVDDRDEAALAALAAGLEIVFLPEGRVLLNGEEVSLALRGEAISAAASRVAALPAVRAALLFRQRALHRAPGLVGDGRDMASVVFPDAALKIFLTASPEVRAERRFRQLREKGLPADRAAILSDLRARDERDRSRSAAPLRREADARLLDTDALDIEAAVAQVLAWWSEVASVAL